MSPKTSMNVFTQKLNSFQKYSFVVIPTLLTFSLEFKMPQEASSL